MMLKYVTVRELTEGTNGRVARCGIAVYQDGSLLDCIPDVVADPAEAERLAEQLNQLEASALHFRDIVEDYVASR